VGGDSLPPTAAAAARGQPARVGYLLNNRVTDPDEFVDALRRVGAGRSAIDPQVVADLPNRLRANDPLGTLTPGA
jgi:hypothetical protein